MSSAVNGFNAFGILILSALTVLLLPGSTTVCAAPAKFDSNETPFPLEFQPPLIDNNDDRAAAFNSQATAIDSYGHPIDSLKPIDTPDGRKVVSAQGLQFEIPNYASGITEIKKPSDDLLPPFVGELRNLKRTRINVSSSDQYDVHNNRIVATIASEEKNLRKNNNNEVIYRAFETKFLNDLLLSIVNIFNDTNHNNNNDNKQNYIINNNNDTNHNNHNNSLSQGVTQAFEPKLATDSLNPTHKPLEKLSLVESNSALSKTKQSSALSSRSSSLSADTSATYFIASPSSAARTVVPLSNGNFNYPNIPTDLDTINRIASKYQNPLPTLDPIAVAEYTPTATEPGYTSVDIENAEIVELKSIADRQQQQKEENNFSPTIATVTNGIPDYLQELNDPDIGGPTSYTPQDNSMTLKVLAWDLLPPVDSETQIITQENYAPKRIVGEVDPTTNNVKVSLSTQRALNTRAQTPITEGHFSVVNLNKNSDSESAAASTTTTSTRNRDYNAYTTTTVDSDGTPEKVVVTVGTRTGLPHTEPHSSSDESDVKPGKQLAVTRRRGSVYYTTTTQEPRTTTLRAPRTTHSTTTTTHRTTRRPIKTASTQHSTTTTKTTTTAAPTTTTTAVPLDPSTFYKLEHGDSFTLPAWLADIDDPELDAAVLYVVPEDLKEYNVTVEHDLVPPFEPFVDLNELTLPAPYELTTKESETETATAPTATTTTSTTTRRPATTTTTTKPPTTTTQRATVSTPRSHWVRAKPKTTTRTTTEKPTSTTFNFLSSISTSSYHDAQNPDTSITTTSPTIINSGTATPIQIEQQHLEHLDQEHLSPQSQAYETNFGITTPIQIEQLHLEHLHQDHSSPQSQGHEKNFQATNQISSVTTVDTQQSETLTTARPFSSQASSFLQTRNGAATDYQQQRPQPFAGNAAKFTTAKPSTTSTTTTTPAPLEVNPFDSATIPSWLQDFEDSDIGPGVPFIYDAEDPKNAVFNDLLPPSQVEEAQGIESIKTPVSIATSPASFNSHNSPQSFSSLSSISPTNPSNIMLEHSSNNHDNHHNQNDDTIPDYATFTQPPLLLIPPIPTEGTFTDSQAANAQNGLSSFNQNFAAPFNAEVTASTKPSIVTGADQQSFPPSTPTKTTFTKSDDGKVITNNVFLNSAAGNPQQASKPFGFIVGVNPQQKAAPAGTTSTTFDGSFSPAASGFTKVPSSVTSSAVESGAGGRYTGSFGGAPGILGNGKIGYAVQPDGSIIDPDHTYRPPSAAGSATAPSAPAPVPAATAPQPTFANRASVPATIDAGTKYHGTFGGPPGVLVPYDNVNA